ncbi:MAG: SseB family protein [Myxococcota bacterium]
MSLKPFASDRDPMQNQPLRKAIARLDETPGAENRAAVHRHLAAGPLLVAIRDLPRDVGRDPAALDGELPIRFVTSPGPQGTATLCVFSDLESVAARAPAAVALAIDPATLLNWIADERLEGIVLNPQGPSLHVSREQLLRVLGRGGSSGRSLSISDESENEIREALARLAESDRGGAALEISEPRTGKSMRFSAEADGSVRMDVAGASLSGDEWQRAKLMFDELAGHAEELPAVGEAAPEPIDFVAIFAGDVGRAAKAAVKVFTWVFGFPAKFELRIEER